MSVFNFTGTNTLTALITLIKNRFKTVDDKIKEIELFKFPNATIYGSPTINNGQISNFSANNYLAFPFVVDFQNRPFTLDFEITTGSEITQQHNIFDSVFGLAFAVRQSKFVVAISTNGTSWNMGEGIGTHTLSTNTTYRVRMTWNLSVFKVSYSTDGGSTYIDDISKNLTAQPYPKQILIGITSDKATFFNGVINLNYASLTISDKVVWTGMDDVGLATRADVSLSNIDANGEQKIKDVAPSKTSQLVNDSRFFSYEETSEQAQSAIVPTMNDVHDYILGTNGATPFTDEEKLQAQIRLGIISSEGVGF